jgi:hypothetical protein
MREGPLDTDSMQSHRPEADSANSFIRPFRRAVQGSSCLVLIATASCLVHRKVIEPASNMMLAQESRAYFFDTATGVDDWGPTEVADFITALAIDSGPAEREVLLLSAERAKVAEIDGDLLLHVAKDPSGYLKILGLDGVDKAKARQTFTDAVDAVRRKTQTHPKDFWEYRSGNREAVFLIEQAVLDQPRTLLCWLALYEQGDVLDSVQIIDHPRRNLFWLMVYLLPNTLLVAVAIPFWSAHKYLVSIAVVVGAVNERAQLTKRFQRAKRQLLTMPAERSGLVSRLFVVVRNDLLSEVVSSLVSAAALWCFWRPLWRCLPWFVPCSESILLCLWRSGKRLCYVNVFVCARVCVRVHVLTRPAGLVHDVAGSFATLTSTTTSPSILF